MTPAQQQEIQSRYDALIKDRRGLTFHEWNDCATIYTPVTLQHGYRDSLQMVQWYEKQADRTPLGEASFNRAKAAYEARKQAEAQSRDPRRSLEQVKDLLKAASKEKEVEAINREALHGKYELYEAIRADESLRTELHEARRAALQRIYANRDTIQHYIGSGRQKVRFNKRGWGEDSISWEHTREGAVNRHVSMIDFSDLVASVEADGDFDVMIAALHAARAKLK